MSDKISYLASRVAARYEADILRYQHNHPAIIVLIEQAIIDAITEYDTYLAGQISGDRNRTNGKNLGSAG